jgi:hypothetical protein
MVEVGLRSRDATQYQVLYALRFHTDKELVLMPLYTNVVVTLKITLSVPEDTIYDNESYFKELKDVLTDTHLGENSEPFEEVDKITVELLDKKGRVVPEEHFEHYQLVPENMQGYPKEALDQFFGPT